MSKPRWALVPVRKVNVGTKLVCDGGFTCLKDHAVRTVQRDTSDMTHFNLRSDGTVKTPMNSRMRLFIRCDQGQHFLEGQLTNKDRSYTGFWIKGTEPPKEKTT
jgi:hypothetical protein